jgi:predicted DNA-binding transcriptional regulator YafY
MMVLFLKHVHLQKVGADAAAREINAPKRRINRDIRAISAIIEL